MAEDGANMRASRKTFTTKDWAYIGARPVLPPRPARPPPDTPEAMRAAAERGLAFERHTGAVALGTCVACRETRLGATYREGRCGEAICFR